MTDNLTARIAALLADLDGMLGNTQPALKIAQIRTDEDQLRQVLITGAAA